MTLAGEVDDAIISFAVRTFSHYNPVAHARAASNSLCDVALALIVLEVDPPPRFISQENGA